MRRLMDALGLESLSAALEADADELAAVSVADLARADVGHPDLARALEHLEATAKPAVDRLETAATAMSTWMRRAAQTAGTDERSVAVGFSGGSGSVP